MPRTQFQRQWPGWRSATVLGLTYVAWAVIVAAAGWVLVAVGWWLIAHLWLTHIFVPWAVAVTTRLFLALTIWGLALSLLSLLWRYHNRRRYHNRERRRLDMVPVSAERWSWSELTYPGGGTGVVSGTGRAPGDRHAG